MVVKAVDMVREIRDRHYELTKGLPLEEQIEFFKQKSEELQEELKKSQRIDNASLTGVSQRG